MNFIIPQFMLNQIVRNTVNTSVRDAALESIAISGRIRGQRDIKSLLAPLQQSMMRHNLGPDIENRVIYTAGGRQSLPGQQERREGGIATSDTSGNRAYDGAGWTWKLYEEVFHRNSVDGNGLQLVSSVHYGQSYDNAFWNGSQMVYGDGDGRIFNDFTSAIDVIGHELTHGVTQYSAGLDYQGDSGALNESMSDCFGSMVKQYSLGQTSDQADWLIGAGLLAPGVNGVALRSMKAPGTAYDDPVLGKDPQPADMGSYIHTQDDNGGVHLNSGIPNRAFYLACKNLGGHSWDRAGPIWYDALTKKFKPTFGFIDAANAMIQSALELFGADAATVVTDAWAMVGIGATKDPVPAPIPPDPNPKVPPPTNPGCLSVLGLW